MNEPKLCNQSQFYGFIFHIGDLFAPVEKEVETIDVEYIDLSEIKTPKLLENASPKD